MCRWRLALLRFCVQLEGDGSWWEYDARGIELARVCDRCKAEKLAPYRREVLTDANYSHEEPIDDD